jgi:hypothetical protein
LNPAVRLSKLEAATRRFPSILLGGSLIPIVIYRDGDGFSLAKHIPAKTGLEHNIRLFNNQIRIVRAEVL